MTREKIIEQLNLAIDLIKQDGKDWLDDRDIPMLEECVKALKNHDTFMKYAYSYGKADALSQEQKIQAIVSEWQSDTWTDNFSNECMRKIADIVAEGRDQEMTREEAIKIIRKEYACVDADCDIERSCGKCDLMMPSKEPILRAYEMAIQALSQEPGDDAISRKLKIGDEIYIRANVNEIRNDYIICENKGGYFGTVREEIYPSVQSKSGEWIPVYQGDEIINYRCSECELGDTNGSINLYGWGYCRRCGAKMVEPQESEE